jgi:hypothetical protein
MKVVHVDSGIKLIVSKGVKGDGLYGEENGTVQLLMQILM